LDFVLLDVFTDRVFGGNQLAVFPHAGELPDWFMSAIARELKVNETVFVTGRTGNGFAARIFSPHGELPFAGHPVIGSAFVLADQVPSDQFELNVPAGPVPIEIVRVPNGQQIMLQSPTLPLRLKQTVQAADLAAMLSLSERQIAPEPAEAYSAAIPFFCIPLADPESVKQANLDKSVWARVLRNCLAPHIYIFSFGQNGDIFARMFAPAVGIDEDAATGAAAVALGGYLAEHDPAHNEMSAYTIHQGAEIGRPSQIRLEVSSGRGALASVRIGGQCVLLGRGELSDAAARLRLSESP